MASNTASDLPNGTPSGSKTKKHRKKKTGKSKSNGDKTKPNGMQTEEEPDLEGDELSSRTPTEPPSSPRKLEASHKRSLTNGISGNEETIVEKFDEREIDQGSSVERAMPQSGIILETDNPHTNSLTPPMSEADRNSMAEERDTLREEVAQVRGILGEMKEKHAQVLDDIQGELAAAKSDREQAEAQYRGLLGKVSTIRSQLGERLKADAEDLSQARSRIEDLEEQCSDLREQNESRAAELATMAEEGEQRSKELSGLRNRTTLSQQNWSKEREDALQREAYAKEEFEAAKQAMQDWEILAREERSIRESMADKVADLEDQITSHRDAHEKAASERDSQSSTVDGLQRALQEIQEARKRELREFVENSQTQVETLSNKLRGVESQAAETKSSLESTKQDLERALPFEKEVKEKNLLIGKLRHEAVILNDHLTKALRYLKKGKPEDTIDKQLVTNHFLHFLALERADPKKFQVLQIIANLLAWTDEQREQAGLARPGASNPSARVPVSPWHRTPSTPALSTDFFPEGGTRKESLADLWSDFLEQEAQEGITPKSPPSSSGGSRPP